MDNQTILWIVIGVAVLLVIIAIIYAVTRNNDDDARRRPMGRRGGMARGGGMGRGVDRGRPGVPGGRPDTDRVHDSSGDPVHDGERIDGDDDEHRRRGHRGERPPRD